MRYLVSLVIASLALSLAGMTSPHAASITCREHRGTYEDDQAREFQIPSDRPYCKVAEMVGPIDKGEAARFREWLRREPYTHIVKISSPGGSVDAAMEIGRIIRSRFMTVWTHNHEPDGEGGCSIQVATDAQRQMGLPTDSASVKERQAVCTRNTDCRVEDRCCLSACVLILAGGASRDARNIGLHRPSLKDFPDKSYEDTRAVLGSGAARMEQYLKEMEISPGLFATMMSVPPDEVRLLDWISASALFVGLSSTKELIEKRYRRADFNIPPSIYDWLRPRCSQYHSDDSSLAYCLWKELNRETVKRSQLGR